jgi:hypothetical protein
MSQEESPVAEASSRYTVEEQLTNSVRDAAGSLVGRESSERCDSRRSMRLGMVRPDKPLETLRLFCGVPAQLRGPH